MAWRPQPQRFLLADNLFHPIRLATISELAGKELRASLLSADSLLETLLVSIGAPLAGWVAQTFGVAAVFFALGAVAVAINRALLSETRCCGGSGEGDGAARGSGTEAEVGKADGEREGLLEGAEEGQASETARE